MRNRIICLLGLAVALQQPTHVQGQQILKNGYEGVKTSWEKGSSDSAYDEKAHAITDLVFHDGKHSEYLQIEAKQGSFIHYQYPVGRAPIGDELAAGVWVKADRPSIQLLARLVLPNERDPNALGNNLTTLLLGDTYQHAGQWKRLTLGRPVQLAQQQQLLMQAKSGRSLDFKGAYIDLLLLNVYAGPGPTQVWIDDLEIGPVVPDRLAQPATRTKAPAEAVRPDARTRPVDLGAPELKGNKVVVGNKAILFRAVRYTDTMLAPLAGAGFNTVLFDENVTDAQIREAADLGFWVAPQLALSGADGRPIPPDQLARKLSRYDGSRVLFVRFGGMLTYEQAPRVSSATRVLRQGEPNRLITGDVWDGLLPLSGELDLVGIHRWPLMTTLELPQYREWLELRKNLANPGAFTWTWIQTHMPEWHAQLLYEQSSAAAFAEPVGPQPEHIRLLTYTALAAGCRGLAYYSDRFLADSHQGRDRLLSCALLNQEMDMLEPLLVEASLTPEWVDTSAPDVKAAVLRCPKGVLVLPMWQGLFSQIVPGQAATSNLSIVVPQVPQSTQAWVITPGSVKPIKPDRVHPGTKVILKEFGLTSAILFTNDTDVIARLQDQARARQKQAAQWSFDLAEYELEKITKVQQQLDQLGKSLPEAPGLLQDARRRLDDAKAKWENRLFGEAYHEAQRALRPMRLLMRAQWEKAVRGLDTPVAIPYGVSYYTLTRHWQMREQVRTSVAGDNLLRDGDFEDESTAGQDPWQAFKTTLDDVELVTQRAGKILPPEEAKTDEKLRRSPYVFTALPKEGKRCHMLQIRPKGLKPPPQALDRTQVALTSAPVRLQPGTLVQISAWIQIPSTITASPDGALLYESAGGEPLGIRLTQASGWKKYSLYRRVPADGTIQVTLALTGLGTVLFDDVRVEELYPENSPAGQQARANREARGEQEKTKALRPAPKTPANP